MRRRQIPLRLLATLLVVVAGTAAVARAAGLHPSSDTLGAVSAALPVCAGNSVTVATTHAGGKISKVTLTLTSCAGAAAGNTLYAVLDETTTSSIGDGSCTLAGTPPACAITMTPTYSATDSYTLEVLAEPGAAGTTVSSANNLKLVPEYLTLRTCSTTAKGPPTTC
jgi:hypothetical protein